MGVDKLRTTLVRFSLLILCPLALVYPLLVLRAPDVILDAGEPPWLQLTDSLAFECMLVGLVLVLWRPETLRFSYPMAKFGFCYVVAVGTGWTVADSPFWKLIGLGVAFGVLWTFLPGVKDFQNDPEDETSG